MADAFLHPPSTPSAPNDGHDPRTYAIIGCALEVFFVLGSGFLERVYQEVLANEMRRRGIPFEREVELPVSYKGDVLDCKYRIYFVCYGDVLVELKALTDVDGVEAAQVLNYLKASSSDVALLFNFGGDEMETKKFSMSRKRAAEPWRAA